MIITNAWEKSKVFAILFLASLFAFGFGYLAGFDAGQGKGIEVKTSPLVDSSSDGRVLASRSGSKYFLPWCAAADRIAEENRIWFDSGEAARAAGYTEAENCTGL